MVRMMVRGEREEGRQRKRGEGGGQSGTKIIRGELGYGERVRQGSEEKKREETKKGDEGEDGHE